jgi:hypothetical protein
MTHNSTDQYNWEQEYHKVEKKSWLARFWGLLAAVGFLIVLVILCGWAFGHSRDKTAEPPVAPIVKASVAPTTRAGVATSFKDGTFIVGKDIKAGKYKVTVPKGALDFGCYWARLKGITGEPGDIIVNGFSGPGSTVNVEIKGTDVAFDTNGCGVWKRV